MILDLLKKYYESIWYIEVKCDSCDKPFLSDKKICIRTKNVCCLRCAMSLINKMLK